MSERHLRDALHQKGFRVRYLVLAMTLLDASEHSVVDLADFYAQRWQVELDIRSFKTHMQMEYLRCKSPAMVRKEIYVHMIAYNLIRDLIVRTALRHSTSPKIRSPTGAVQVFNAFSEKWQAGCDRLAALEDALFGIDQRTCGRRSKAENSPPGDQTPPQAVQVHEPPASRYPKVRRVNDLRLNHAAFTPFPFFVSGHHALSQGLETVSI